MKQLRRAIQVTLLAVLAICAPAGAQPRPPDVGVLLARLDDLYRSKSSIVRVEIDVTTPRSTRWFGHRRAIRDVDTQRQMVGSVERHLPFGAEPVGLMLHSQYGASPLGVFAQIRADW